MTKYPLRWFFILTFAITWGLAGIYFAGNALFDRFLGEMSVTNPFFILAVWGPNIAGVILTGVNEGWRGILHLLKKFIPVRANIAWYLVALFLFPFAGLLVNAITGTPVKITAMHSGEILTVALAILISGPLGEELGWRGFALPKLLKSYSATLAGIILGLIWGLWHLPSFFASGLPQGSIQIPLFLVAAVAISVIVTWIFVNTKGNVFISFLVHYTLNFTYALIEPDFTFVMIFQILLAVALFAVYGRNLRKVQKISTAE